MTQNNAFYEVSLEEMFFIDGGKWKWKSFGKSILGGAVGGAVGGAATYLVCGWW